MWPDGDFAFQVSHYFGQAPITVQLCTKDMLGSSHCFAQASLTLGEVVAAHQSRLVALGSPTAEELHPQLGIHAGWLQPGDDPLIHRVTMPLHTPAGKPSKGTVTVSMVFLGGVLHRFLGPLNLNSLHRCAAGGMADLLRHMLHNGQSAVSDKFKPASSGLNPADYAAQGSTVGHFQCLVLMAFMLRSGTNGKNVTKRKHRSLHCTACCPDL